MIELCFNYSRFSINILSILISLFLIILLYIFLNKIYLSIDIVPAQKNNFLSIEENFIIEKKSKVNNEKESETNWKLQIPKIQLDAEISDGTSEYILDNYIGHFEETEKLDGNIGLAAHNRGYKVNYFARLKELETGDEIFYNYNGIQKKYIVLDETIILETDWKYLENTLDNRLTLITCVEDMPEYRRCIQAIEKKEE